MSAYTPDDPEQLTYEEMESERDRLAMELYHSQIEAEQLRAERDALLDLRDAAVAYVREHRHLLDILADAGDIGPGNAARTRLATAVDALENAGNSSVIT